MSAWRAAPEGLIVTCRLTPKGGRDALEGIVALSDGRLALAARVRAAPEDGKANAALCRLIAEAVGAPPSRARLAAGAKSRIKQVFVEGEAQALTAALERAIV